MAITATQEGRNLHLHVEGLDPFIVKPLPGEAGYKMTEAYLSTARGGGDQLEATLALVMAVDGAVHDPETDQWTPVPEEERTNSNRMGKELSTSETEDVAMAAFFWQTILGAAGVSIYLENGGGVGGHTKALGALVQRLGLSPLLTSPSSALENLIQLQASIPSTSTPEGGKKPGRQPQDRLPKKK
ncbi:hypothetical protein GCM10022239_03360 [Leifsonia bigeumensis]|uniref:Uncharacterized protein n=1 Tax=Leifsonella bigeumensis TaxID=433643 RepID=A0ABP7F7T0_9MICO